MTAASVVVITRDLDVTADLVVAELGRRDVRVARFDLADFPEKMTQIAYLVDGRTRWTGALRGAVRDVDLSGVRSVWYRKPSAFRIHPEATETEQQWATAEARMGLGGLLASLPGVRWVNHPHRNVSAADKPHQLAVAARSGLRVPDTLISNDPDQARDFCRAHPEGVVYKPMTGAPHSENGQHTTAWVDTVTAEDITGVSGERPTCSRPGFRMRTPSGCSWSDTACSRCASTPHQVWTRLTGDR